MKKILFGALASIIVLASCSKSDDPDPVNPAAVKYMSVTAGSSWNYAYVDNNNSANNYTYTVTSTNRDSTALGKTYHVFTNSNGGNDYYNITGSDYYALQVFSLAGSADTTIENLYLKDGSAVGTSWTQTYTIDPGTGIPVAVNIINTIQEKGVTRVVNGISYSDVIHIVTTINVPTLTSIPQSSLTTDIHYYYAPKYGQIENDAKIDLVVPLLTIDDHTNVKTTLQSSAIL